jgi:hypothetical protein
MDSPSLSRLALRAFDRWVQECAPAPDEKSAALAALAEAAKEESSATGARLRSIPHLLASARPCVKASAPPPVSALLM